MKTTEDRIKNRIAVHSAEIMYRQREINLLKEMLGIPNESTSSAAPPSAKKKPTKRGPYTAKLESKKIKTILARELHGVTVEGIAYKLYGVATPGTRRKVNYRLHLTPREFKVRPFTYPRRWVLK